MGLTQLNDIESAIIVAVKKGFNEIDELAKILLLPGDITVGLVTKLVEQGYLSLTEKNMIIMQKKTLQLTEKGEALYDKALLKLKELSEKTRTLWKEEIKSYPQEIIILVPFLAEIGLLDKSIAKEIYNYRRISQEELEKEVEAVEEAARMDLK